jgi:hypothetical protein
MDSKKTRYRSNHLGSIVLFNSVSILAVVIVVVVATITIVVVVWCTDSIKLHCIRNRYAIYVR